ncbi:maternal embryonic leucine zipper kinase [Trichonephila inaurata madagascariensis]|uniref:Serine/threonine-protein kinase 1 n=1 Tax=Trichonephila inaurata madagascariensis TaxID=2747483 RepID=A0A8X6JCD0_9ARAC|nr:maternal embryonic leucine zipper kinase [Trichonephila inaurata madagascariensis]
MLSTREELKALRHDYTLKHLSSGSYGKVYVGENVQENVQVAIKVIEKRKLGHYINSLPAEIYFLSELKNEEGIIHLINHIECTDGYIIIMEYSSKFIDLYDYVFEHLPLSVSTVKKIILQIVEICIKLFKLNIYHGDLKLENIVIHTETLTVKFIDFGGAGYLNEAKEYNGTKYCLPPEYDEKKIYEVEPVHVWAIGLILSELLSERREEEDICEKDAVLLQNTDEKFKYVINECLNLDYVKRIKLSELKQIIENELVDCCEIA